MSDGHGLPDSGNADESPAGPAQTADTAFRARNPGPGGICARPEEPGHRLDHFAEEIRARMPTPDEVRTLHLASGVPVIHLIRTAHGTERRAVEVCDTVVAATPASSPTNSQRRDDTARRHAEAPRREPSRTGGLRRSSRGYFFLPWVWRARFSPLVSGPCTRSDLRSSRHCWSSSVVVGHPWRAQRGPREGPALLPAGPTAKRSSRTSRASAAIPYAPSLG
ncbi:hypothetical protein ACE1SV_32830 [Streptomyces sennicomposti]